MIDNYDSFTYNLVQYFGELGEDVRVARNDQITPERDRRHEAGLASCASPGPARRPEAGISVAVIRGIRRQAAHPGRLPGPPGHRHRPSGDEIVRAPAHHAWQDGAYLATGTDDLRRPAHAIHGDPLQLPDHRSGHAAGLPGSDRHGGRDGDIMGVRSQNAAHIRRYSSNPESVLSEHGHALMPISLDIR